MSEDKKPKNKAVEKSKKEGLIWILVGLALVVLGTAFYMSMPKDDFADVDAAYSEAEGPVGVDGPEGSSLLAQGIDVESAKRDRILGNPSAPIKISEHASLTCSHCGHFHKTTFAEFKKNYIDTGKAYLVFTDFPLNAPALHASMVARCVPEEKYFDIIHDLFEHQEDWAFETGYMDYLKGKAQEYGLSEERFKACIQSKELQDAIVGKRDAAQKMWGISSTPSFVVNNKVVIGGALPYADFDQKIQEAVSAIENGTASPETNAEGE